MAKYLYDVSFAKCGDIIELSAIWEECFSDTPEDIARFFSSPAFIPENSAVIYENCVPVSMLFLLESDIFINGEPFFSYYVYAVATKKEFRGRGYMSALLRFARDEAEKRGAKYLFLVPENEPLFGLYEKNGYKGSISYCLKKISAYDYTNQTGAKISDELSYNEYRNMKLKEAKRINCVVWRESAFQYIFSSINNGGFFIRTVLPEGFCFYEKENGVLTVTEICGEKEAVLNALFEREKKYKTALCRVPAQSDAEKFGMYLPLTDSGDINNIYFGHPYG